ncbi:uncharacterized protein LTR77_002887 [Saxophila tyrrhenica]|uniref:Uncharacterized protein n=1 Tax=Saxophila tyrrhenica TaxID=1690608 RepID=A0AAV9PGD2_9PEZI|nr:hypothetical protein LTR77_002887 [Saxophila tyrrhenica]
MASEAAVCPVVGTTTSVLPPDHPAFNADDLEARCPVTNAKVEHHNKTIHNHPSSSTIPNDGSKKNDATKCPALANASSEDKIVDDVCPVVGPVSAMV